MTHIFYSLRDSPNLSENKSFKSLVFFFDTHIITQVCVIWQELERDGIKFKSPSWSYNGFKIWGLTAMITAIFVNDYFDAEI